MVKYGTTVMLDSLDPEKAAREKERLLAVVAAAPLNDEWKAASAKLITLDQVDR